MLRECKRSLAPRFAFPCRNFHQAKRVTGDGGRTRASQRGNDPLTRFALVSKGLHGLKVFVGDAILDASLCSNQHSEIIIQKRDSPYNFLAVRAFLTLLFHPKPESLSNLLIALHSGSPNPRKLWKMSMAINRAGMIGYSYNRLCIEI